MIRGCKGVLKGKKNNYVHRSGCKKCVRFTCEKSVEWHSYLLLMGTMNISATRPTAQF